MPRTRPSRRALCAAAAACFAAAPAHALTVLWWDFNGAAAGTGGSGQWDGVLPTWATVAGGASAGVPALPWPAAGGETVATFGGTAGTVTLKAHHAAAELSFLSDGYTLADGGGYLLTLGSGSRAGVLRVAAGASATVRTRLASAHAGAAVELHGGGTLVLDGSAIGPAALFVYGSGLRLGRGDAASASALSLRNFAAALDLGSAAEVEVGSLSGVYGTRQQIGSRTLRYSGQGGLAGQDSSALALQGDAAGGVIAGTQSRLTMEWTRASQASSFGFFHLKDADITLTGHRLTLLSTDPGRESLHVAAGSRLLLQGGAVLAAQGAPVIDGTLRVTGEGTRFTVPGSGGVLHVGGQGGEGLLEVGDGAAVAVGSRVVAGHAGSGAGARLALAGSTLSAPLFGFATAASQLELGAGAVFTIAEFDTAARGAGAAGRVLFSGGTLVVGDMLLDDPLLSASRSSSFAGLLSGGGGVLRKVGGGTLGLSNDGNDFRGRIVVEGGTLAASTGALRQATLTLQPGAALQMTPDAGGLFGIGALDGRFDLDVPAGRTLALGTPGAPAGGAAAWAGRFTAGNVALLKLDAGTQTLLGAGPDAVFSMPRLTVSGGTLALDGGSFAVLGEPGQVYQLVAHGGGAQLQLGGGALLESRGWALVGGGATLQADGAGTLLRAPSGEALPLLLGSSAGPGTLRLQQGARAELSHLLLDFTQAGAASTARVESGAALVLGQALQFEGAHSTLTVDGGSVDVPLLFVRNAAGFDGRIELSDAAGGKPALTVREGSALPEGGSLRAFNGRIVDAAGGPGSLRKVGSGSFPLLAPLEITGRMIVEGGTVALSSAHDLQSVTLVAAAADALDVSALAAGETLRVAALAGDGRLSFSRLMHLELGGGVPRDAAFDGTLALQGALGKVGSGKQLLSGGGAVGTLSAAGGVLVLDGRAGASAWVADGGLGVRFPVYEPLSQEARLQLRNGAALSVAGLTELTADTGSRPLAATVDGALLGLSGSLTLRNTALRVEGGGRVASGAVGLIDAEIAVDGGTLVTTQLVGDAASRVWLADGSAGAALTLRREGVPGGVLESTLQAALGDAPGGSGSVHFTGRHVRYRVSGSLANTGALTASGPEVLVELQTAPAARSLTAADGAALLYVSPLLYDAGSARITTSSDGSVHYNNGRATLRGGVLVGTGHWVGGSGFSFEGTTLGSNARLLNLGAATLRDATLRGELRHQGTLLTLDNTVLSAGGTLRLQAGSALLRNSELNGLLDVGTGIVVTLDGATAAGAGSRSTLATMATLAGSPLLLNGGLLVNNGRMTAPLVINHLGKAKGAGSFGSVTVNDGGTFAPGNSPGLALTGDAVFGVGGVYEVELADALGGAGAGHDQWRVQGTASFAAGTTANSAFTLQLVTLGADGGPGTPLNWDASRYWRWTVLVADAVQGWSPGELRLDSSRFGAAHDGRLSLQWSADGLVLDVVYAPVPEPATWLLALGGALALLGRRRARAGR